ncbi:MAG: rRNA methylase family protein [Microgenomates group bacterium GW2011_GWA2_44_7]|nr:MAG: rRNA methylase family protein [Microgenomates group bacterium GW2011_GWA2_44_7]KKT77983.1 MAG: rRNA methylase family protein [Microgenomates group bacterium GW2011_GWB1_44_8]
MDLLAVLVIVVALLVLLPFIFVKGKDAPFVPTEEEAVERIMEIAEVGANDIFYDLGSGDGRLVIAAAVRGAKAVGIEMNPLRVWYSRIMIAVLGQWQRARIIQSDFFNVDLSEATVIVLYLLPKANEDLKDKLLRELRKGARLVTVAFPISGFELVKEDPRGVVYGPVRLYKVPEFSPTSVL